MVMMQKMEMIGERLCDAVGNKPRQKRRNPYAPTLLITAASITEPPVGAST